MAHSKRNTSLPHFTAYERSLLRSTWGTQRTRLSRESFLPFSSCRLCLVPARTPVVACATNGDIFCRECAVNDLLAQRKEIKRLERERELAERDKEEGEGRLAEEARERELREFEMVSMGLEERKRKLDIDRDRGGSWSGGDRISNGELARKRRKGFELDEKTMRSIAQEEREKIRKEIERERSESSKSQLPSFWVPSLTPSTSNDLHSVTPVKLAPLCPASTPDNKHNYSLKNLITVNFTEDKDKQSGETIRICPSCKKVLSNGVKSILTKPCGHVICKPCVDKFMTPHENPDPHATDAKDKETHGRILCYVCETDVTERKRSKEPKEGKKNKDKDKVRPGLVTINSEGTGFAGGGENMAKKAGTAFQC
ncbi:RING finger domain-containing protein, variant [Blastomyces gilchristii SLH14081]|uniref:RING finger domain-containing protein n=1 Tax=Blastomyces gilchristii (strain SLH14081) TaxID=559298 RepID=A0A179V051_BLAGS|nr:RING finger domain-containing protein [Blastomyces gilchristii SLH14081]XP_031580540.1 RING finger domain-containing protein, variant [Blastomyces gilchristii SLH14081]OAT12767.1 RING finger domain-containing protein [Blastomyces gilchristii SLH14081]OAT12768.1 RING finger domain-containing protein, variant [Blastomyces gilchristii SLH14081]